MNVRIYVLRFILTALAGIGSYYLTFQANARQLPNGSKVKLTVEAVSPTETA